MTKRVLIVTNRADLHADIVSAKAASMGGRPFRLNLDEFPERFGVSLRFDGARWDGALTYLPTGDDLAVAEVGAVWMRKRADFSFTAPDMSPHERAFAEAEAEHVLFSLLYGLDCYWMSHPAAVRGAMWKGEQLMRAARLGFATPPSLVTNRRGSVEAFRRAAADDIVFKALTSPALAASKLDAGERQVGGLATTRITEDHAELLDAVTELPCFFQAYMEKAHELRVTVIGDAVFAARIHSQDDARTAVDYRDFSAAIRYEAAPLPPEIESRCRTLVHSYGLQFGAIDLIVTPAGDHVFLENNPVGQFLFVEQLVPELDMSGALAARLVRGAREGGAG